jgi:preprotein translocase subunit SecD
MKANKIVLALVLCVCALTTHFVLKPKEAEVVPKFEAAATLVVELLPIAADGEALVLTEKTQERTAEVLRKRLDPEGSKGIAIENEGLNRLVIGFPEVNDLAETKAMIEKVGRFDFREQRYNPSLQDVEWITRMSGDIVNRAAAQPNAHSPTGSWEISFDLTAQGQEDFASLTEELVGKPLGIFIDDEEISAPIVQSAIPGGQGVITGNFTEEEAKAMANYLTAGALPVKVKLVAEERDLVK